jgi:hypothetical protein
MKTHATLALVAGLLLAGLPRLAAAPKSAAPDNVAVTFQDSDKYTDAWENQSTDTSPYYLDLLKTCLQTTAAPLLAPGQKLAITVLDVDLAGDTRRDPLHQIRVMTATTPPHIHLKFQLLDADGKVLREGDRRLSDLNYQDNLRLPGDDEPLYYDKQLLSTWVRNEFRSKS